MESGFTASEAWSVAGIGFGSAMIGAALALAGSWLLSIRSERQRKTGLTRAMLGELIVNSRLAVMACRPVVKVSRFSDTVWNDGKFEIAQMVSREAFSLLLGIYSGMWIAQYASEQIAAGDESQLQAVELWYATVQTAYELLLTEAEPSDVEGWTKMMSFEEELQDLESRLGRVDSDSGAT